MTWTASVAALQSGRAAFKYGYFPDAATPFESDATFMQRRRAMILGAASGVGRIADVVDAVARYPPPPPRAPLTEEEWESGELAPDRYDEQYVRFLADELGVGQWESTVVLAVLAAVALGWKPLLRHDRGDPLDLVNDFLLSMRPWNVGEGDGSEGNYDFLLANLVTAADTYGHLLSQPARGYLVSTLLSQRGPIDEAQLKVKHGPFGAITYRETENHILQIEVARYLTNQLIGFDNTRSGVTRFLLRMLQGFLQNDFSEYNSRPYQDHSVRAITALYDLGRDPAVRTGAQLVLEYLAVKFAVSSNGLRRHVPFRRRREHTWDPGLFDDEETKRFLALTGMGRLYRVADPGPDLKKLEPFSAVPAVLTAHRPPLVARDLIMTHRHKHYYQRFKHSGVELFYSTPAFLITAGGIRVGSALGSDWAHLEDISVPLATTLMPSGSVVDVRDVIRIAGNATDEKKVNTGVVPGFICGLNSRIPARYESVSDPHIEETGVAVVNPTQLPRAEGFYFAVSVKTHWAHAAGESVWLVAVPAIEMPFDRFRASVLTGEGSMVTMDSTGLNRLTIAPIGPVAFTPAGDRDDLQKWPIRGPNGQWYDCSTWPLAAGDVINSEGHSGVVHVDHPVIPFMSGEARRGLRISPVISVRQEAARRGIDLQAGLRRTLQRLEREGVQAGDSLRRAFEVVSRRLTLDMRDVNHSGRIAPRFTAREVALMLGRGLVGDISVKREATRRQLDLTGGMQKALSELRGRGIHTDGSVTRAFEALSERPSPTGDVSIRACFNYYRVIGATEFKLSALLHGG